MELDDCIRGRRSVRAYTGKKVPRKAIDSILEAGTWAPSGMNAQPCEFIVVEDGKTIKKLSDRTKKILRGMEFSKGFKHMLESDADVIFYGAPLLILVCVKKKDDWKSVNLLDCGLAAQNMFLKAYEEGLGSCFIGFGNFLNSDPKTLSEVGMPDGYELMAPLIFGYPAEKPEPKPRKTTVLKWVRD